MSHADQVGFREERDSMGVMRVPTWALWGASTQRAVENFPIGGQPMPAELIHAYGRLKAACATVNRDLNLLDADRAQAIIDAANEVASGRLDAHFPVDIYQTGSGTSTNMNVNEVITNHAQNKLMARGYLHPNDHVNLGQSSNDTFPSAIHLAASWSIRSGLIEALSRLQQVLDKHARDEWDVIKVGRTHLMDATPIRMGQVFSGYASQAQNAITRARAALDILRSNLPIGGTAVGTGINTHPQFGVLVCKELSRHSDVEFHQADNLFEAQSARDAIVEAHGQLRTIAVSLSKIANDIRLLSSGPRCGLGELTLPATQPGSSIMPGKVNPVMCESVIQVTCRVIGNDATITTAALGGVGSIFELNVAMPVIAHALLESIRLLTHVTTAFVDRALVGLRINADRCNELVEQSLMMVTSLAPVLGYDTAAELAKEALQRNVTIRQLVLEKKLLDPARLENLLNPQHMTEPGASGPGGG